MRFPLVRAVLRVTAPVGMGYVPAGFAFGALATQAGFAPLFSLAMSVFVYAGALQYAAIPLLAGGGGLLAVALTTLLVNLRHVLYAVPLLADLPRTRLRRLYVVAALTDETWSVLTTLVPAQRARLATGVALVNQGYWVGGTALGVLAGAHVSQWVPNLDFALPALFTILAIEQYQARRRWQPAALGVAAYLLARALVPGQALLVALLIGLALLLVLAQRAAAGDGDGDGDGDAPPQQQEAGHG